MNYRCRFRRLVTLLLLINLFPGPLASATAANLALFASSATSNVVDEPTAFIRKISLRTNDLAYSPSLGKLYASVPSTAGSGGNSITTIDPATGTINSSVFVGSEPNKLALSDDGHSLYVSLEGARAIRRFDAGTQIAGLQFPTGEDNFSNRFGVIDLAVAPGNPNLLAVARADPSSSGLEAGVAVFDNGVARPNTGPPHTLGSASLAFSASASKLYGTGFISGLTTLAIDAAGVSVSSTSELAAGAGIKFSNNRIFSSAGHVINPDSNTLLGTFSEANSMAFVPDSSAGRVYFLVPDPSTPDGLILKAFSIDTFLPVGSLNLTGVSGAPTSLVRWGANGLAFRTTGDQLFIIQTSLIPSVEPIPTPTPVSSPTPASSPTPHPAFVKQIALPANDLVHSNATQKIYASVPSAAGSNGNSIAAIDPELGTVTSSVFVGSEPTQLAPANDGMTLYMVLKGAAAIRSYNIISNTAGPQFPIGHEDFGGLLNASDLVVAPNNPSLVAVARQFPSLNPPEAGTAVYDNGVSRTNIEPGLANGSNFLAFSSSGSTLYGSGFVGLRKMTVDSNGVNVVSTVSFDSNQEIVFANNLIYGASGQVVNPSSDTLAGTFTGTGLNSRSVVVDSGSGRIFFLVGDGVNVQIKAYDANTFLPLGFIDIQGTSGTPKSLVRWGSNGLAFRTTNGQVFIIETTLVDASVSIPTPTPTPSPTPSPSPAQIMTFVRKVELTANGIVFSNATQALYASVPGFAGSNGNSITKINPRTGEIGPATFIGSEPNKLAISADGQTLYAHLDGANAMRRFDVVSQTPGLQFPTSSATPVDMRVVPGSPQSIAVSRGFFEIPIYDDAIPRPNSGMNFTQVGAIDFGSTASTLYGYNGDGDVVKFLVDGSGITHLSTIRRLLPGFNNGLRFSEGLVYSGQGGVADPEAKMMKGTFQVNQLSSAFTVDSVNHRAFYVTSNGSDVTVSAFDTTTFLFVGSITLPGVAAVPVNLVRWGGNGLALNTVSSFFTEPGAIYLMQSELVSNAEPVPTGVQFEIRNQSAFEVGQNILVKVNRTGNTSGTTTVAYATADGTATAGSDYTPVSGTLSFAPGEVSKSITVPILDDNLYEAGNESFTLNLSAPPSGTFLMPPSTAEITISDNELKPSLSVASTLSVTEGDAGVKSVVFNVSLSHPTVQTVTVDFATTDFTATAGSDYVANSGVITLSPGTTSASVSVLLKGDPVVENDESFFFTLSNAPNVSVISSAQTHVTILNDDTGVVFSPQNIDVFERTGIVTVTVVRFGRLTGVSTVDFKTNDNFGSDCSQSNGVASAKCDFATAGGTLQFGVGETVKSILISVIDDGYVEGTETITLTLSNPVGMTLESAPASGTISIVDTDFFPGNPFNENAFFVRQQYLDFLFREPDLGGFIDWFNVLTNCGPNQGGLGSDPACDRVHVSSGFFRSTEFGERGYWAYRFYHGPLGRRPNFAEFVPDMRRLGGFRTPAEQEVARAAFVADFMQRAEFVTIYAGLTNSANAAQFIAKLEEKAGVTLPATVPPTQPGQPPQFGRAELIQKMQSGEFTAAQTLRAFIEQKVVFDAFFFKAFVAMQYFGYLLRDPEEAGYNDWVDVLTNGRGNIPPGDFRHLLFGFVWSVEYRQRFGPP